MLNPVSLDSGHAARQNERPPFTPSHQTRLRGGTMKLLEGQTNGIDLGTTYSSLAQLDNEGKPISIPNSDGKTTTPSVVLLGESGHVILVPSPQRISVAAPA